MARMTPLWTMENVEDPDQIKDFLAPHGIDFAVWGVPDEAGKLACKGRLEDSDKSRLLELFRTELEQAANDQGYVEADVIAIRKDLPGLDEALAKFDKVHYHDDDEVRAIVGGGGVFGFVLDDGRQLLLAIEAGEYISVPAGMWHWFYCFEDRNITCLRLFKDSSGWIPHYRSTERGITAAVAS